MYTHGGGGKETLKKHNNALPTTIVSAIGATVAMGLVLGFAGSAMAATSTTSSAATEQPSTPTNGSQQDNGKYSFVVPTGPINIYNSDYITRRDVPGILAAVKGANKQNVKEVKIDESTGDVVITYNDGSENRKSLSEFTKWKETPKAPIIRNGGQNLNEDGYPDKPLAQKNTVYVFRGDKTSYSIDVAKGRVKEVANEPESRYAIYDLKTKKAIASENKFVLTESFELTKNAANGYPELTVTDLPKGLENKGFTKEKDYVEGTSKSDQFLSKQSTTSKGVAVYKVEGTAALDSSLGDHAVTHTVTLTNATQDPDSQNINSVAGVINVKVAVRAEKYDPSPEYKDGKNYLELNTKNDLTADKVKEILKATVKKTPNPKDKPSTDKKDLPKDATVEIDETSKKQLDNAERGKEYDITVHVRYADDKYNDKGETDENGHHSTDKVTIKVKLKEYKPTYADTNAKVGTPATSGTPTIDSGHPDVKEFKLGEGAPTGASIDENGKVTYTPKAEDDSKTISIPVTVTYSDKTTETTTAKFIVSQDTTPTPTIDPVKTTDTKVTGKSVPGATVTVTFPGSKTVETTAGTDGKFSVDVPEGVVLKKDDVITAVAQEANKKPSSEAKVTVTKESDNGGNGDGLGNGLGDGDNAGSGQANAQHDNHDNNNRHEANTLVNDVNRTNDALRTSKKSLPATGVSVMGAIAVAIVSMLGAALCKFRR